MYIYTKKHISSVFLAGCLLAPFLLASAAGAAEIRPIVFPVSGKSSFGDDFGDPRSDGRTHEGNDIMAPRMTPLISAVDGTVSRVNYPEATWGNAIIIRDADGYQYWYLHVNNDNPGTDDGQGGGLHAYATDIIGGNRVLKGQVVGWVGDSGNAEGTSPHLHFEIHAPGGSVINPYESLKAATRMEPLSDYPALPNEILPYGKFQGGASVAAGNFGGDATLVTGAGPGGSPHVKVMLRDGTTVTEFFPYPLAFTGGVDVAAGDIDGDGIDEIITGAGPGGGPHVRVFKADGTPVSHLFPYPKSFRGGVRVAAADLDNDGKFEIITGAGPGGGPHVRVFKADGTALASFFAYADTFRGGVDVAAVGATGATAARIVTSPLAGGGPHVRVFDAIGTALHSFFAYPDTFRGGVKITLSPATGNGDFRIITVPASKGGPDIRIFSSLGTIITSRSAFEPWWRGGYEVSADGTNLYITADKRRVSIRTVSIGSGRIDSGTDWNDGDNSDDDRFENYRDWYRRRRGD